MTIESLVECRSEVEYPQRPLAFSWQGQRLTVQKIIAEKRTPDHKVFRVLTPEGEVFELAYSPDLDQWTIHPISTKESA
jgi:hypothetical protein